MNRDNRNSGRGRTGRKWPAAILAAALGLVIVAARGLRDPGNAWLASALTERPFVFYSLIALGCGLGLVFLGALMWRMGAAHRPARDSQEGVAMLEFAMVLPIALMLVLLMIQASMLMGGQLCVNYAAYCAARTAIVTVPQDQTEASGEGPNVVDPSGASSKMRKIQLAAMWAVMPVCCNSAKAGTVNVTGLQQGLSAYFQQGNAASPGWVQGYVGPKWSYAQKYTTVTLAPPADSVNNKYKTNEDLVVSVTHTFYLSVPCAARIFSMGSDGVQLDFGPNERGTLIRSSCRLTNEGVPDTVDPEAPPQGS